MHHFYRTIIRPILNATKGGVVEIGADKGANTRNLVRHCKEKKKKLVVVDVLPGFDANQLMQEASYSFQMLQEESLKVLPFIKDMGTYLIDGDHNWYTVYNELKLIEKNYPGALEFPVLIFHDTEWPYARRDCYYEPNRIPKQSQNPHQKSGIKYGEKALSKTYRFNEHLDNAILEGGAKNGVLTAIEDFIQESTIEFEWLSIPVYHGFGIMVSKKKLESNSKLQECLEYFNSNPFLLELLKTLEKVRANEVADLYNENAKLRTDLDQKRTRKKGWFNCQKNT